MGKISALWCDSTFCFLEEEAQLVTVPKADGGVAHASTKLRQALGELVWFD